MQTLTLSSAATAITSIVVSTTISSTIMVSSKLDNPVSSSSSWKYRIEGSQKVVFSNSNLNPSASSILCLFPYNTVTPQFRPPYLIRTLLHPYLIPSIPLRLSSSYVSDLFSRSRTNRPPRRVANTPTTPSTFATLNLDAALFFGPNTILVEIKPKTARPSISKLIPPQIANLLCKYSSPPYHLKNYLLPHNYVPLKAYHPSDILSGCHQRATAAVNTLLQEKARGLRVFQKGILQNSIHNYKNAVVAAMAALSADQTAVKTITELQGMDVLDGIGAEIVLCHLKQLVGSDEAERMIHSYIHNGPRYSANSDKEEQYQEILKDLSYSSPDEAMNIHCQREFQKAVEIAENLDAEDAARLLGEYLQASTAKDCSILIALCQRDDWATEKGKDCSFEELKNRRECSNSVFSNHNRWDYRIWVVDVGAKPLSKIEKKWGREDRTRAALLAKRYEQIPNSLVVHAQSQS